MPITEQFKQIFSNDYCGFDTFFEKVLAPLFGNKIERKNENLLTDDRYRDKAEKLKIKTMTFVAQVEAFDPINVIDITVDNSCNLARSRVYIKELVRQMLENYAQAFIIFHYENVEDMPWRFSYIYKEGRQTDVTAPKRFTYVFGRDYSGRTAAERFATLQGKTMDSAKDFKEAFSVESLSDEFFYNYRAIYANFVQYITGKRIVKKDGKWEEEKIHDPNEKLYNAFNRDDKRIRDYIKKTLGRLTFLYFVERKGWLNNNRNFMRQLFEDSKYKDDYLDCVLEPLFYTILNTAPDDRRAIFEQHNENCDCEKEVEWDIDLLDQWKDIPFLNGGLFERDEDDVVRTQFPSIFFSNPNGVENYAGKEKDRVPEQDYDWEQVPGLLDFFEQYNFTIDENDPNDAEVGVDPEMLGRIFENLLEDNKDKGVYYTPKEIVQYMCRESLIAYLQTDATDDAHRERLRRFVETHDAAILHDAEYVLKKIENVKICDPAIGSGAFPMGLLNELVACREALGLHIDKDVDRAEIKKHIIQNSIYGVDIEKGAVDIARLRFWLSIVVDEESSLTLPNLDYKIMQGNSLLESFMGVDLSRILPENTTSVVLAFDDETAQQTLLYEKLHRYFDTGKHSEKAKLRTDIDNLVKGLVKVRTAGRDDITNALANFDVSGNDQFFLWHTWFHDVFSRPSKEGFDIVIGNPPYIQLQNNGGELAKLYENCGYKTFARTGDIYCLFYERGWQLLKKNGHLCYITSNKWMRAGYGEKTREFFANKTNPMLLIDFAGVKIFESATVDTNILLFAKSSNKHETVCAVTNKQNKDSIKNLSDFVQQQNSICDFSTPDSWVILSPIEQSIKKKIESVGTPLKDWDINIYRGVLTGCNEAFIINSEKRDEILANCQTEDERQRTDELIRPILRGRDIKRYGYVDSGLYLINTHNGVRGRIPRIKIEDYPAVKAHLDQYWDRIATRADKGDTPYNLRNCAYLEDFSRPKIVYPETTQGAYFAFDDKGLYIDKTCFMLITDDAEYLQHTLSSRLFEFAYKRIFSSVELGEHGYQYNKHALVKLPIIKPHKSFILDGNNVDEQIYKLYGITNEEIRVIESP